MDFAQVYSFKNTDIDGPSSKPTTSGLFVVGGAVHIVDFCLLD